MRRSSSSERAHLAGLIRRALIAAVSASEPEASEHLVRALESMGSGCHRRALDEAYLLALGLGRERRRR
jgi:hypothetical protein